MTKTDTALQIPDDLKPADGRFGRGPSLVRPEQFAYLAAGWRGGHGNLHRQAPVQAVWWRVRAGLRELFSGPGRVRGRARKWWHNRVLGGRDLLPRPRTCPQPRLWGVLLEVRRVHPRRTFLADPIVIEVEPGEPPSRESDPDADVIGRAQNETSTGVMVPVTRPDGAGDALILIDATSAAAGLPVDVADMTPTTSRPRRVRLRRRPVARAAEPAGARANRSDGPRIPETAGGFRTSCRSRSHMKKLGQGADLQHAGDRDAAAARRPVRGCSTGRSGRDRGPHDRVLSHLYEWATSTSARPVRRGPVKRSWWSGRSTSIQVDLPTSRDVARTDRRRRAIPKLGGTSCGRGCSGDRSSGVEALTACVDWVLERRL